MAEPFDTLSAALAEIIKDVADGAMTEVDAAAALVPLLSGLAPVQWEQLAKVIQVLGRVEGQLFTDGVPADTLGAIGSTAVDMDAKVFYGPKTALGWGLGEQFVGDTGPSGTITSVTVATGAPGSSVALTLGGTPQARTMDFTIPRGDVGATGAGGTITSATASTGAVGSEVSLSLGGTPEARTMAFTIPRGDTGAGVGDALEILPRGEIYALTYGVAATFARTGVEAVFTTPYYRTGLLASTSLATISLTFSRTGAGTALDLAGNIVSFATGVPRITNRGILVEKARTNQLLNSATLSTQNVTVTAVAQTLSFYGTGTVTLSGVSTAGPLVGTGVSSRVTLTFTPTAGTLTLTVSGSVTSAQLEAGTFPTSYIPTTGAAATRAVDAPAVPIAVTAAYTLVVHCRWSVISSAIGTVTMAQYDNGGNNNRAAIYSDGASIIGLVVSGGVAQASVSVAGVIAANAIVKAAIRVEANNVRMAVNGTLSALDNTVAMPVAPTTFRPGCTPIAGGEADGYIERALYLSSAVSDAQLVALTT